MPEQTNRNEEELPENFDSNKSSKHGRVEGSEGECLWVCRLFSSTLRPGEGG